MEPEGKNKNEIESLNKVFDGWLTNVTRFMV